MKHLYLDNDWNKSSFLHNKCIDSQWIYHKGVHYK